MLYAKVVFGLPVEGPFDYIVPPEFSEKIRPGSRVKASFGFKDQIGYVVSTSSRSGIKKIKNISVLIDEVALLDANMLIFARQLADYYCCSWGQVISTALPEVLRRGKPISILPHPALDGNKQRKLLVSSSTTVLQNNRNQPRWEFYIDAISKTLDGGRSAILLFSDTDSASEAKDIIVAKLGRQPALLYRKKTQELEQWLKVKRGEVDIAVGTRSAVFAPFNNLGLIIIDEESDSVYKQDQVPHYHARQAAVMRCAIDKADLILADVSPSLEALYLSGMGTGSAAKKVYAHRIFRQPALPLEIKMVDMGQAQYDRYHKSVLSRYLIDKVAASLGRKEKILLFLNRLGFATFASCASCNWVLKCPRCNKSLVYHFKQNSLNCHYCNYKTPKQELCPKCNCGYIKYSGTGTEKIESELARLFPQARIKIYDEPDKNETFDADICVSAQSILKAKGAEFGFIAVLAIDHYLNHIDFRAAEKALGLLLGLSALTKDKLLIQTGLFEHHLFKAFRSKDLNIFYNDEFKQRKELYLPPYSHLCLVKLRSRIEEQAQGASQRLFDLLINRNTAKSIKIAALNPAIRYKLRDNYCWEILIKSRSVLSISSFLKKNLKDFPRSGIIVTVDMDPV